MCVKTGVPFEGPQFLDTHLTYRPVHEEAVDEASVTRDAEGPDAVAANRWGRGGLCLALRGVVGRHRVPGPQGAVQHDRGFGATLHIDARPPRLNTQRLTQALATIVGWGVGVEAIAARAIGMVGAVPGQERAAGPCGTGLAHSHRTELFEVEVVEIIGKLLGPAAVPGIPVTEPALVALSEAIEQETPLVQVRLTDCGLRLRADPLKCWQQDRHQQSNDCNHQQEFNQSECSLSAHRFYLINGALIKQSHTICDVFRCQGSSLYTFCRFTSEAAFVCLLKSQITLQRFSPIEHL